MNRKIDLNKEQFTILIIMITEVLGFTLILPFLPFFAMDFGASVFQIGIIAASFSFFQFFSAPILGRLSDHFGRKPLLLISQLSTLAGFLILAFAGNLWMIVLSRVIDGLFGSNFVIGEAYLSDISSKEDRSKAFAISGVAFGIGFLIGPATGGILAFLGMRYLAFFAAGISLVSIILTATMLRETIKPDYKMSHLLTHVKFIDLPQVKRFFNNPLTSKKLTAFIFYIFSNTLFISVFALFVQKKFALNARDVGFILAYVGIVSIALKVFIMPFALKYFSERRLTGIAFFIYLFGVLWMAISGTYVQFLAGISFYILGTGLLRPLLLANLSVNTSAKEQGSVLGITTSFGSIAQIIGPAIGGTLLHFFVPHSVLIVVFFVSSISFIVFLADVGKKRIFEVAGRA